MMIEAWGWARIIASPFFAGLLIGTVIYVSTPTTTGLFIGMAVALAGLAGGIIWAVKNI